MRILMVLEHEYPEDERVTKEIKTLQNNGHLVSLACVTKQQQVQNEIKNNIEIIRNPISKFKAKTSVGALKFPFYFNFWFSFINSILTKNRFDAIHIHDLPLAKVGYNISRKYNMKFVLDLHENWPVLLDLSPHTKSFLGRILSSQKQWLEYEKKYASIADGLIVVAEEMKQRLLKKGVINQNIVVVPNTSKIESFEKKRDIQPDSNYLTLYYAGGITQHRGLDVVIHGLSKVDLPNNFRFWIVGAGKNERFLKEMTHKLNLANKVYFLGWKPQSEVLELLFKSDIAIIPHYKSEQSDNSSPNKLFHYMLAEKPLLATDCNSIKSIVEKTNCGIIYKNNSPDDFVEKLKIAIDNQNKRKIWGRNGLKAAKEIYNWDKTSKSIVELYNNF